MPIYQTQLIIGAALLEGGAFLAAIAYMVERKPAAFIVAAILLGVLISRVPTVERLRGWVDWQLNILENERQAGY